MNAKTGRTIHKWMMAFWLGNLIGVWFIPVSWRVQYIVLCSVYANFVGHWSGWSAERPSEIED